MIELPKVGEVWSAIDANHEYNAEWDKVVIKEVHSHLFSDILNFYSISFLSLQGRLAVGWRGSEFIKHWQKLNYEFEEPKDGRNH